MFKKILEKIDFEILNIDLKTRDGMLFLDVELNEKSLDEITKKTKIISTILDEINFLEEKNYYLNVFSSGTEKEICWEEIESSITKNIFIRLRKNIFGNNEHEGELLEADKDSIIMKINLKGLIAKRKFNKGDILQIKESAKIGGKSDKFKI